MRGVDISVATRLHCDTARGRCYAGGPLSFCELLIGPDGAEELLPVEAAEALFPEAREALRRLADPRVGPQVLGGDVPRASVVEPGASAREPMATAFLRLQALSGDAAARARALREGAAARVSRGWARERLILDPGPIFSPSGFNPAAFETLPRLLHLGGLPLADLRGAPPGAMGLAAGLCMDRGALLLEGDEPARAIAARDAWLVLRGAA